MCTRGGGCAYIWLFVRLRIRAPQSRERLTLRWEREFSGHDESQDQCQTQSWDTRSTKGFVV